MKIPHDVAEKHRLYLHVADQCSRTIRERRARYSELRNMYVFGNPDMRRAKFNKIKAQVDQIVSFMYASESVRFDTAFPKSVKGGDPERADIMNQIMQELWLDADTDESFSHALTYAMVYGATFIKVWPMDGEINVGYLNPGNFGVYDESAKMTNQEAVVQKYMITKEQLERQWTGTGLGTILGQMGTMAEEDDGTVAGMPLWITSVEPNLQGSLNNEERATDSYLPSEMENVVEMSELWIYDDEIRQFRTVKIVGDHVVSDHPNVVFKESPTLPFVRVCPNPLPDYFWGASEVALLEELQLWREERIDELRLLMSLQVKPPKMFSGMAMAEEKALAMFRPGGILMSPQPNAKMDQVPTTVTPNMGQELQEIDAMFSEASAITPILAGESSGGGKNAAHAAALAELAGARVRKRVLLIEKSLDDLATKMMVLLREQDDTTYEASDGKEFILMDLPGSLKVRVAAHSSSPLFKAGTAQVADTLLLAQAIDKKTLVELLDPPMRDQILERVKIAEANQAKMVAELKPAQAKQLEKSGG